MTLSCEIPVGSVEFAFTHWSERRGKRFNALSGTQGGAP